MTRRILMGNKQPDYATAPVIDGKIELGDRVRDKITKLNGIVNCVTFWLNGCVRVGVQTEEHKDGKPLESTYFDVGSLDLIEKGVHEPMVLVAVPSPAVAEPRRVSTGGPDRESSGFAR